MLSDNILSLAALTYTAAVSLDSSILAQKAMNRGEQEEGLFSKLRSGFRSAMPRKRKKKAEIDLETAKKRKEDKAQSASLFSWAGIQEASKYFIPWSDIKARDRNIKKREIQEDSGRGDQDDGVDAGEEFEDTREGDYQDHGVESEEMDSIMGVLQRVRNRYSV